MDLNSLRLEAATNWLFKAAHNYLLYKDRSRIYFWSKAGLLFCEKHEMLNYAKVKLKPYFWVEKFETKSSSTEQLTYSGWPWGVT